MMGSKSSIDQLCINTIRFLAVDAVEQAGVGHLGTPLGAAPMAYILWDRFLRHDPVHPEWADRDRFILSCGHASLLLYALLHLTGYDLGLDQFKRFREWESKTPGHPEYGLTPGVEATTGPLGQGFAFAVGMAIAERHLGQRYNRPGHKIIDHHTYVLVSDGDLQEGVSAEAASLAGSLGLGKLIALYDDNDMQIEGPSQLAFREDVAARFRAYDWHVLDSIEGEDLHGLTSAMQDAILEQDRPSLIAIQTRIGFGSPVEGTAKAHHGPLGPEGVRETKSRLGWPSDESFWIPDAVQDHFGKNKKKSAEAHAAWQVSWKAYSAKYPGLATEVRHAQSGDYPAGWDDDLEALFQNSGEDMAPRKASGKVLNLLAERIPSLIGGSADLAPSTSTLLTKETDFSAENPAGRNLHFGVREHAMAAAGVGMALHGGVTPFVATYLAFSDYLRPTLRLSGMMGQPLIYIFTHDSIAVGKDGPTHQAVEQLMSLRAVPNLVVIRPADVYEVAEAWRVALNRKDGPTALVLARQDLPVIDRHEHAPAEGLHRGGYILWEGEGSGLDIALLATGSEVHLALDVGKTLQMDGVGVRVVSIPSWELFDAQSKSYRNTVLPTDLKRRLSLEAGITQGWEHYIGLTGLSLGVDGYGASASEQDLFQAFGLTTDHALATARRLLAHNP